MKTILYIDNNQVQVLEISRKRKKYTTALLESGTVLNGVILDSDKLQMALEALQLNTRKVTLVIGSSNLLSKKLTLPKASKAKLNQMVKGEFDLFHAEQNYQYDTNVLSVSTSMTVMGYAVNQDLIDTYLQVCKDCGLVVERVEFMLNGLINYISKKSEFHGKTFLFNMIYGEYLLSMLFENGRYKLSNRIRLLHVGEGELFHQELYSRLSAMTQFSSSERSNHTITDSYYVGISEEDVAGLASHTAEFLSVKVQSYGDSEWNMDYFMPALAIYEGKRDINFAIKHDKVAERSRNRRIFGLKSLSLVLLLGLLAAHSLLILRDYSAACDGYDQANAVATSEVTLAELENYADLRDKNTELSEIIGKYDAVFAFLNSGATLEQQALEQVFEGDVVESFSFDFATGAVYIQGIFPTNVEATDYAARLREKGFFVTMDYNGYHLASGQQDGKSEYSFTITAAYDPVVEIHLGEVAS